MKEKALTRTYILYYQGIPEEFILMIILKNLMSFFNMINLLKNKVLSEMEIILKS